MAIFSSTRRDNDGDDPDNKPAWQCGAGVANQRSSSNGRQCLRRMLKPMLGDNDNVIVIVFSACARDVTMTAATINNYV